MQHKLKLLAFKKIISPGYTAKMWFTAKTQTEFLISWPVAYLKGTLRTLFCHLFILYFELTNFTDNETVSFLIGIYSMQSWTATTGHRVTRERTTKKLKHTVNPFRKNLQIKGLC